MEGVLLHLKIAKARLEIVSLRLRCVINRNNENTLLLTRPDPLMGIEPL